MSRAIKLFATCVFSLLSCGYAFGSEKPWAPLSVQLGAKWNVSNKGSVKVYIKGTRIEIDFFDEHGFRCDAKGSIEPMPKVKPSLSYKRNIKAIFNCETSDTIFNDPYFGQLTVTEYDEVIIITDGFNIHAMHRQRKPY